MLSKLNRSVDPCSDFYEFACGTWIAEAEPFSGMPNWMELVRIAIDAWETIRDAISGPDQVKFLSSSQKKAAKIYESCVSTKTLAKLRLNPLKKFLNSLGGWDLLRSESAASKIYESNWNFQENLLQVHRKVLYPLFRISAEVDARNTSRYILAVHQPVLTFPALVHYMNSSIGNNEPVTDVAKSTLRLLLAAINVTARGLGAADAQRVVQEATKMAIFEAEIAMTMRRTQMQNHSEFHALTSLRVLNSQAPFIKWDSFIENILSDISFGPLNHNQPISFGDRANMKWLKELHLLMQKYLSTPEKRRTVDNYMKWRAVIVLMGFLDSSHLDDPTQIIKTFTQQNQERWLLCMLRTTEVMGMPLASLYLQLRPAARIAKTMVEELSEAMIEAMKLEIEAIDWMDEETKKTALSKAKETLALVGYSEEFLDVDRLDREFAQMKVHPVNFMANMMEGLIMSRKQELRRLQSVPIRSQWDRDIALLKPNAYYNFEGNRIVIPMAITAPSLFVPDAPKYINYGAIGSIIGHELTHGFDYKGRTYGEHGNIRPWWSQKSAQLYFGRSKCLIHQYNNYTLSVEGEILRIDGQRTFSENLADNGGLKIAYRAYQKYKEEARMGPEILPGLNLTSDQGSFINYLFFLSFAQTWCSKTTNGYRKYQIEADDHAAEKFRVLGPLHNMPEFGKAFQCPVSSPMNPKKKCSSLW